MKIEFTSNKFIKQKIECEENIAFLIGSSGSGKTQILQCLKNGFLGKNANFFVNDQVVSRGQYQVVFLEDHFDLKEEIKLSKTSNFRHQIIKKINNLFLEHPEYKKITEKISGLSLDVGELINNLFQKNMTALTCPQIQLAFKTDKINLENIIDQLLEIHLRNVQNNSMMEPKILNKFLARMLIFNILLAGVDEKDIQRPIIILFDNPEIYTNPRTMFEMNKAINEMIKTRKFYFIFATNSVNYLLDYKNPIEKIHFLKDQSLIRLTDLNQKITLSVALYNFLLNNEYQDWNWYWMDFQKVFTEADLDKEKENFLHSTFNIFFKLFYFSEMNLILEVNEQKKWINEFKITEKKIFVTTSLKSILILHLILNVFFSSINFGSKFKNKTRKMADFFEK